MNGRVWRVLAASGLMAVLVGPVGARPARAVSTRVTMAQMKFTPDHLEVQVGDIVSWMAGDDDHTVTARDGSFDSSPRGLMGQGDEFRWRFRVPGTYPYSCRIHGDRGMQGVITVTDPSAPTTTTTTRLSPATAAATTSTTAPADTSTATAAPTTSTTRVLATSSTTSLRNVATTTAPPGVAVVPQPPPALNQSAPVLDSNGDVQAGLPEAPAASRRSGGTSRLPVALGVAAVAVLLLGGGLAIRRRGSRARPG